MVTSFDDPNLPSKLTKSLHGLFAGSYLAGVFYGLTTHQTFVYFRRSRRDPLFTRLLVLLLWIFDTFHAVFAAIALLEVAEESIVNPLSMLINRVPWTLSFSLFMMSFSDSGVRGFYCYRIWRLSQHNMILTTVAAFPIVCALVAGLYTTSKTVGMTGLQALDLVIELDVTLISICVADSILAGSLCVLLWNSRSGIKRTNSVISTLILYTVTTGLLTSLVAIATLIMLLTMKETFAYAGAFYMLSKLYFSSLLATLNRREKIRTQMDATSGMISGLPLGTSNTRGNKEISVAMFASVDEASTTMSSEMRSEMHSGVGDPEAQTGVKGAGGGGGGNGGGRDVGKSGFGQHETVEIKLEKDAVRSRKSVGYVTPMDGQ